MVALIFLCVHPNYLLLLLLFQKQMFCFYFVHDNRRYSCLFYFIITIIMIVFFICKFNRPSLKSIRQCCVFSISVENTKQFPTKCLVKHAMSGCYELAMNVSGVRRR